MSEEHIASAIKALKEESAKIHTQDNHIVQTIDELIIKLESDIHVEHPQPMSDQLSDVIDSTEARYPRLTLILNDLMMKLAGIGV